MKFYGDESINICEQLHSMKYNTDNGIPALVYLRKGADVQRQDAQSEH